MRFQQTHSQGLFQLLLTVSWDLRAALLMVSLFLCSFGNIAWGEVSRGPLKGAVSAQNALQGSQTETTELLGGPKENSVSPMRGHWFALQANQWFCYKKETGTNWVSGQTWWVIEVKLPAIPISWKRWPASYVTKLSNMKRSLKTTGQVTRTSKSSLRLRSRWRLEVCSSSSVLFSPMSGRMDILPDKHILSGA